jgi:GT2 family glycosyltransferase
MKVSFVIPIFDHWHLINDLMVDVHKHTHPDEIIIVDDYSSDKETLDGIAWWAANYDNITVLRPAENLGFLKASNYGVSKATGDIICLISSDVRIEDDLANIVKESLKLNPKLLIGGVVYRETTGWNDFDSRIFPYAEGWLLCCLKSTWEELGGFDERYAPHDFEDVDLSTNAVSKGYTLASLNTYNIRHLGAQTIGYNGIRNELTMRNREKFRTKWLTNQSTTASLPQTS